MKNYTSIIDRLRITLRLTFNKVRGGLIHVEQKLTTVHEALAEAAAEINTDAEPMKTYTFRAHLPKIKEAEEICRRQGTTLPEYLRKCVELLPRDLNP